MKNNNSDYLAKIIVIVIIFTVLITSFEAIVISYNKKKENTSSAPEVTTPTKKKLYDTSNMAFNNILLNHDEYLIGSLCQDGCNISTQQFGSSFKLIIKKNRHDNYTLDLVKDNVALMENKNLGSTINDASLFLYSNYVTFKTEIIDDVYDYDYAILINDSGKYDEFESLDAKEMRFLDNGIVYYYDECIKGETLKGLKHQTIRAPFSSTPQILGSEDKNFTWCA